MSAFSKTFTKGFVQQWTMLNLIINWGFWSKDTESDYFTSLEDELPYYSLTEKE